MIISLCETFSEYGRVLTEEACIYDSHLSVTRVLLSYIKTLTANYFYGENEGYKFLLNSLTLIFVMQIFNFFYF